MALFARYRTRNFQNRRVDDMTNDQTPDSPLAGANPMVRPSGDGDETRSAAAAPGAQQAAGFAERPREDEDGTAQPYAPESDRRPSGPLPTRDVRDAVNGSMVQDFADLKRLGREMERMKTGAELRREGLVPDPQQQE
jgi:hypothetical protein